MLWATGFRRLIRGGERVREVKIAGVRGYSLREKTIRATGSAVAPRMEQVGGPAGGSRASSDAMARVLGHPGLVLLGDLFDVAQRLSDLSNLHLDRHIRCCCRHRWTDNMPARSGVISPALR